MNLKLLSIFAFATLLFSCDTLNLPSTDILQKESAFNQPDLIKAEYPDLVSEVRSGKVAENLKITAIDGSFTLTGGQTFKPSDFTDGWKKPGKGLSKQFKNSIGKKVKVDYDYDIDDPEETGKKIKERGQLYGILELNRVYEACTDLPVARTYYLDVPYSTIVAAQGARISVAYEYYDCSVELPTGKKESGKYTSWVLWLSDVPF